MKTHKIDYTSSDGRAMCGRKVDNAKADWKGVTCKACLKLVKPMKTNKEKIEGVNAFTKAYAANKIIKKDIVSIAVEKATAEFINEAQENRAHDAALQMSGIKADVIELGDYAKDRVMKLALLGLSYKLNNLHHFLNKGV